MAQIKKRVAFLATGEELIHADFLDTNSVFFAQKLVDHGIPPGQRLIVGDNENDIQAAISYLLSQHDALITIGGLGPTLDDRTRYGLSQATGRELVFDEQAWQWIVDRLKSKGLAVPETNRQQALFPQGSRIIPNPNGTAAACALSLEGKDLFMLPGPPNEARPIFETDVLPYLLENNYTSPLYRHSWLLLGVSESEVAEQLEKWMPNSHCHLGYRVHSPYLEVKLWSADCDALEQLRQRLQPLLQSTIISEKNQTASSQLITTIKKNPWFLSIQDDATYGHLATVLYKPDTRTKISFCEKTTEASIQKNRIDIKINGLDLYWSEPTAETQQTKLTIAFQSAKQIKTMEQRIPIRKQTTLQYAVEIICWKILNFLEGE